MTLDTNNNVSMLKIVTSIKSQSDILELVSKRISNRTISVINIDCTTHTRFQSTHSYYFQSSITTMRVVIRESC